MEPEQSSRTKRQRKGMVQGDGFVEDDVSTGGQASWLGDSAEDGKRPCRRHSAHRPVTKSRWLEI